MSKVDDFVPLTDPREIRIHISKAAYRGDRIDNGDAFRNNTSIASTLTRRVCNMADYQGYSGEDKMTILAYHALLAYERAIDTQLITMNMSVRPQLIVGDGKA